MVVNSAAFAGYAVLIEHPLHPVENLLVHQRLVTTGDLLALVADDADVVPASENPRPFLVCHRLRGALRCPPRPQPAVSHDAGDVDRAVVAAGIQLEACPNQWSADGVDLYGSDLAAVVKFQHDVQVADAGLAEGAAFLCFLAHLVGDVCAVLAGAVLVERRQDAVHQLAYWCVIDRFGRADQRHTALLQVGHDDRVVKPVAREAGQLVHDDVVDIALAPDPVEHALERDAFGYLGGGPPRFDVLADDVEFHLICFALACDALGGDRDALWIEVRLHLTGCGYPEVEECSGARRRFIVTNERDVPVRSVIRRDRR
nr:hypothetical protein [Nocardia amikacinitolerans]